MGFFHNNCFAVLLCCLFVLVTSSDELTAAIDSSYESMARSTTNVRADELLQVLQDVAESTSEDIVRRLARMLVLLSAWASIESLPGLVEELALFDPPVTVDTSSATLGDFLAYLQSKGNFPDKKFFVFAKDAEAMTAGGALLLDSMMLRRLKDVPEFAQWIASQPKIFSFIIPFGYSAGVNLFNTRLLRDVMKSWNARLHLSDPEFDIHNSDNGKKKAPAEEELGTVSTSEKEELIDSDTTDDDDEIDWMMARINNYTLEQIPAELRAVPVEIIYPNFAFMLDEDERRRFLSEMSTAELIDTYLLPQFRATAPTRREWQLMFDVYRDEPETQLEIASTLTESGAFYSMRALGDLTEVIHRHLDSASPKTGRSALATTAAVQDMMFVIPHPRKSYGFATMLFFLNHPELSTRNIVRNLVTPLFDKSQVDLTVPWVVLDDVAASGSSLSSIVDLLAIKKLKPAAVYASALVQTYSAENWFELYGRTMSVMPFRAIPGAQLTKKNEPELKPWMGEDGYGKGTLFVSFPYMTPDNNCAFMSYMISRFLTLGGNGVKHTSGAPPRLAAYLTLLQYFPLSPFPLTRLHFYHLCDSDKKHPPRYPVVVVHVKKIDPATPSPSRSRAMLATSDFSEVCGSADATFNWVLDDSGQMRFGRLDDSNPLQLEVSYGELGGVKKALAIGKAVVTTSAVVFHVMLDRTLASDTFSFISSWIDRSYKNSLSKNSKQIDHKSTKQQQQQPTVGCDKTISLARPDELDDPEIESIPHPRPSHFVAACAAGYVMTYSRKWEEEGINGERPVESVCDFVRKLKC
eukprot:gnl/Spiro4/17591_TR9378_c0_g1_i1.p1 gnl/Spiro4/17591_TR9378_c0_g1~~gnl/Spiro4/17591_TR9378_c0_g1_i1.p1  ORF type:complete len:807 (-),score=263.50 gnl/Spiro4/17591_TR9378_c0_g1_i1:73-2493(-)